MERSREDAPLAPGSRPDAGGIDGDMGIGGQANLGDQDRERKTYKAFFDGACSPNPGGAAAFGAVILCDGRQVWECAEPYVPPAGMTTSSNSAEYSGLIAALKWFVRNLLTDAPIVIHGDSKLVISQVFGDWRIREGSYVPLAREAKELRSLFTNIHGRWVPRDQNAVADELSKRAMPSNLRNYDWAARRGSERRSSQPKAQKPKQWSWPKKFNLNNKSHVELACFYVLDTRVADESERCFLHNVRDRPTLTHKQVGMLNTLVARARRARVSKGEVAP